MKNQNPDTQTCLFLPKVNHFLVKRKPIIVGYFASVSANPIILGQPVLPAPSKPSIESRIPKIQPTKGSAVFNQN